MLAQGRALGAAPLPRLWGGEPRGCPAAGVQCVASEACLVTTAWGLPPSEAEGPCCVGPLLLTVTRKGLPGGLCCKSTGDAGALPGKLQQRRSSPRYSDQSKGTKGCASGKSRCLEGRARWPHSPTTEIWGRRQPWRGCVPPPDSSFHLPTCPCKGAATHAASSGSSRCWRICSERHTGGTDGAQRCRASKPRALWESPPVSELWRDPTGLE